MLNKAKSSMGKLFTVVKYEILNTSRIFVPLYSVLVIVSLLGGFLFYGTWQQPPSQNMLTAIIPRHSQ